MDNRGEDAYACPSFNSYSSNRLSEIAVKVAAEKHGEDGYDEDFEFSLVREDREFSADEFAFDGQSGPIFPVFNRDLLLSNDGAFGAGSDNQRSETTVDVTLGKLLLADRDADNPPSCSSSDADEVENLPGGTYCVWRPKAADQPSPSRCKKSKSTGSASRRWKFRDLLRRSNSEGKDSFVFLTPQNREENQPIEVPKKVKGKAAGGSGSGAAPSMRSAHEALYLRNRTTNEGDKKKSYLPYRRDLVGFFVNVNVLSKSLPHF